MTAPKNPLLLYRAALTGRIYAARNVKPAGPGLSVVGSKEDVTEQVARLIDSLPGLAIEHKDAVLDALGLHRVE